MGVSLLLLTSILYLHENGCLLRYFPFLSKLINCHFFKYKWWNCAHGANSMYRVTLMWTK